MALAGVVAAQTWEMAKPGYRFEFPRDHFSHPQYQTEWWYYTGNVHGENGRRYGFELTFFRSAIPVTPAARHLTAAAWLPDQIYLAHLALSDLDGAKFYHEERVNRAGPGLAGVDAGQQRCWNGNWEVQWSGQDQQLRAVSEAFDLALNLHPRKPVVVNGEDAISRKGALPGQASHYLSFPSLRASGTLRLGQKTFAVEGSAWMDHEFFTEPGSAGTAGSAGATLVGWDWFSIQLDNGEELMLYRVRRRGESSFPFSSGTFVDRAGGSHFLKAADFSLASTAKWHAYPMNWTILVPSLQLQLEESTTLADQELTSRNGTTPGYWEGAVTYRGERQGRAVKGVGYLEMTGYGQAVWLSAK